MRGHFVTAWRSNTSAKIYFSRIDTICIVKIQSNYVRSIQIHFYGFFQTENKLSKKLIRLPTFSVNKIPVLLRAEYFKISVICRKKKLVPLLFEVMFNFSRRLSFSNENFRDISCEITFAEKFEIQSTPLNHYTQVCKLGSKRNCINHLWTFAYFSIVNFDRNTLYQQIQITH